MHHWSLLTLIFASCIVHVSSQKKVKLTTQALARGWGKTPGWVSTYEEGLIKMRDSRKPLMVILHKEDCPHSQALKKVFAIDKFIQKMAKQDFIMVNLVQEPADPNLSPDGFYVPRILFVDPSMTVRSDLTGKYTNHHYTYEPSDILVLAENMKKAKQLLHTEL